MVNKLISINEVISKIVRDFGLKGQIPNQDFIEWIAEALQFIGGYQQYTLERTTLHVNNFKAKLPCNFYKPTYNISGLCYRLEHNHLISAEDDIDIEIEYIAIPVDCNGYPMVPDDVSYTTACFWYVAKMLALRGELPNKEMGFEYCQIRWSRYCAQARAAGYMPGIDGMQRMTNQFYKLVPDTREYYKKFADLGKEQILNREAR